jgi:hypothetical protein
MNGWEKHKISNFWMQHCTEILCADKAWSLQIYWSLKQEEDAIGNGLIPKKKKLQLFVCNILHQNFVLTKVEEWLQIGVWRKM